MPDREPVAVEDQIRRLHLERFSREDWILAIVSVVLILDLLVLPWFSFGATISVGSATVSIGGSLTGVDAPDAWLGVLALLSCAFLVADLGFERLSPQTRVPSIASDRDTTRYVLACVAAGLIAFKFILHLGRFGELALGFWLAVLLVGALVAMTRRTREARRVVQAPAPDPAPEPGSTA
ncbi:MAG TPA: hypothetical protein VLC49_00550 [Solirubrobacteraceae bacterium]|nr:hypothetical protein [Solirubrobacteraceae bacterium]